MRQAREVGGALGHAGALRLVRLVEQGRGERVVGVHGDVVAVWHVSEHLKASAAHGLLLLHAAHELRLGDDQRRRGGRHGGELHLVRLAGERAFEDGLEGFLLLLVEGGAELFVLFNELVGDVGVDALELQVGVGLLELAHDVGGERTVHHEHRVATVRGFFHVAVLEARVGRVGQDDLAVLVFLGFANHRHHLLVRVALSGGVLVEEELLGAFGKLLVGEHAVLHKDAQVVPLSLKRFAVLLEHLRELVADLLADVAGDFLDVGVLLEVRAAHVQGDVRRINHAVKQRQEIGDDVLHVVRDEDLVGVEVDAVLLQVHLLLQLGEVEDARQVEGEVHVEVNVEQRVLEVHGVEVPVEFLVVFVGEVCGLLGPRGLRLVHHKRHVHAHLLHVPLVVLRAFWIVDVLRLGALHDFHRHELAVRVQDLADALLREVFLGVVRDVQDDVRSGRVLVNVLKREVGRTVAAPLYSLAAFALAERDDVHAVGHHEG